MALGASAKLAIRVLYRKSGSIHHRFSTINRRGHQSIVDEHHSIGMFLRNYSSASSSQEKSDQMSLIKQLRERTSAPIKDVKSALVECDWNIEEAQKELRRKGVYLAAKKSSRTASEGLLAMASDDNRTAVIELNCETDFVARNDIFQYVALSLAKLALSEGPSQQSSEALPLSPDYLDRLKLNLAHPKMSGEKCVPEAVIDLAAIMGENVKLRRSFTMSKTSAGVISTYLHSSPQLGLGRIAGLLSLEVENPNIDLTKVRRVGSEIAMHIVAAKPLFLTKDLVSADTLESEREILRSQAEASGKPKMAIEKMVEGRMRKYFEEVVLMEQKYVLNDTMKVATVLDNLSKEVGSPVKIGSFIRLEVGEGIESEEATESETVAAQAA
ncbi:hypothetical protein KSS87_000565 [Heliosperma pusillum]|nr:hypothetical protein KSS87_000565 [Heliosperma pusillum]